MGTRRIFRISGSDTLPFLQGLVTNDVSGIDRGMVYCAMLTPQGKFIADFFLSRDEGTVLLDVARPLGETLIKRLTMYKLRADVEIAETTLNLHRGTGPVPTGAWADPRHSAMGWRAYAEAPEADDGSDWDAIRVAHLIPESGIELSEDSYILEAGFEALNGVDFKKGCYVGQEVTARMKHKTELRKGLALVQVSQRVPVGTEIVAHGKPAGVLYTQSGGYGIAYLRFDRAMAEMSAGGAEVARVKKKAA